MKYLRVRKYGFGMKSVLLDAADGSRRMDLAVDVLQASAVTCLLDGQDTDAANVLLACSLEVSAHDAVDAFGTIGEIRVYLLHAEFAGSRDIVTILRDDKHSITVAITEALNASLPHNYVIDSTSAHVEVRNLDPNWRAELRAIASGAEVNNQGAAHGCVNLAPIMWKELRFRSQSEVRVAAALDAIGVLFLPNCLARLNVREGRDTREADFLVCSQGKWGILEVDGPHHEGRAAQDHDRDRLFKDYGIAVVERYHSLECFSNAPGVVRGFLELLSKNG